MPKVKVPVNYKPPKKKTTKQKPLKPKKCHQCAGHAKSGKRCKARAACRQKMPCVKTCWRHSMPNYLKGQGCPPVPLIPPVASVPSVPFVVPAPASVPAPAPVVPMPAVLPAPANQHHHHHVPGSVRVIDYWKDQQSYALATWFALKGFTVTRTLTKGQKKSGPCGYIAASVASIMCENAAHDQWKTVSTKEALSANVIRHGNEVLFDVPQAAAGMSKEARADSSRARDLDDWEVYRLAISLGCPDDVDAGGPVTLHVPIHITNLKAMVQRYINGELTWPRGLHIFLVGTAVGSTSNRPGDANHWIVVAMKRPEN